MRPFSRKRTLGALRHIASVAVSVAAFFASFATFASPVAAVETMPSVQVTPTPPISIRSTSWIQPKPTTELSSQPGRGALMP